MRQTTAFIIVLLLCCVTMQTMAQNTEKQSQLSQEAQSEIEKILNAPVQHKYKFWDNIFFGASVGMNYSLSEYVGKEKFIEMLRPQLDLTFGKMLNKWTTVRTGVWFMSQEASIPQDLQQLMRDYDGPKYEPYNFLMIGLKADGMLCLNRLLRSYRYDEKFRLWLVGGIDGFRSMGFQSKVKEWDYYPIKHQGTWAVGWHVGLEGQFNAGDHYFLTLSALWHQVNSAYNGQELMGGRNRSFATFNIGFAYRFTNSYGEIGFHNCRHNENYYFDEMNRRLNHYFVQEGIHNPGSKDSVITIPTHYSYLTPLQHRKLDKMIQRLEANPDEMATIDVYSDGNETPIYNQFRAENREERILNYITKKNPQVLDRVVFIKHQEASPIPPFSIWSRAGIIRYKKKNEE